MSCGTAAACADCSAVNQPTKPTTNYYLYAVHCHHRHERLTNPTPIASAACAGGLASPALLKAGQLCVAVTNGVFASGSRLVLAACNGTSAQVFRAGSAPNTNRIETVFTASGAYCFDVPNGATATGTPISIWSCGTGGNQQWAVDSAGRLVPRSGMTMCLDVEGGIFSAGAKLVINPCSDAPSQKFVAAAAGELFSALQQWCFVTLHRKPTSDVLFVLHTESRVHCGRLSVDAQTPEAQTWAQTIGTCIILKQASPASPPASTSFCVCFYLPAACLDAAACSGPVSIPNGTFSCSTTPSGATCVGSCNVNFQGATGAPTATCWNGAYMVTGNCMVSGARGKQPSSQGCRH